MNPNITCLGVQAAYDAGVKMAEIIQNTEDAEVKKKFEPHLSTIGREGSTLQTVLELISEQCD